jgi:hypothetical protein
MSAMATITEFEADEAAEDEAEITLIQVKSFAIPTGDSYIAPTPRMGT